MAAPVQSVNYYYGQKTRQEPSQGNCKDVPVENGSNSRDGINCDEVTADKQNANSNNSGGNVTGTMDRVFQDGGAEPTSNVNSARFSRNMDDNRINSDINRYYSNTSDASMNAEDYGKVPEGLNQSQMSGYGDALYSRTNYTASDQHGGPGPNPADMPPNSNHNHVYPNYNQSNMRPSFNPNSKVMNMSAVRPSVSCQNVSMGPQNYANNQRLVSSGHNISQQSGPTPTLNQLLQSPNPVHRYQNSYNEYSGSPNVKANQDMNSGNQYAQQWSGSRNMSGSPYNQQVSSSYRNQGPLHDPSGMKGQQQTSSWGSQGNYPQQQMSPGGASAAAHYNTGGAPYPQRYPSPQPPQQGGPTPPPRSNSRGYPHQQPSYQNSRVSSPQRQQSPVPHNSSQGSVPPSSVPASSLSPSLAVSHGSANNMSNEITQELTGSLDELSGGPAEHQQAPGAQQQQPTPAAAVSSPPATVAASTVPGSASPGQLAPSSSTSSPAGSIPATAVSSPPAASSHHTSVTGNRPVPSPVPNTSRSMSPAVGNQNIPSSPRPSSVHSDTGSSGGSHHNPSPMPVSQQSGYHNQQPHVGIPNGPNSMGPPSYNSGSKMPQGMMGGNMPAGCPPSGSPGYPQGHFPGRGNNTVGNMASGYGMPHPGNNYNAPASQYGAMGNYGPRMANHIGQSGFSPGFGNQMGPGSGHYPPGFQGGAQSGAQAAQAAAQAAVLAAASSATPATPPIPNSAPSRTPHYLKQHLQQKMSGNGPYSQPQTSPGQLPYSCGPPQAASPVGAQTPNSIPPSTPLPPNSRMMSNSMPSSIHNSIPNSIIPSSGHSSLSNSVSGPPSSSVMSNDGYSGGNRENSQPNNPNPAGTSLTQSVGTPITTTTMANSDMPSGLPPPGGHDEASQHSIASTSSSQQEQEHTDNENSNPNRPKCYKEPISHPPTPVSTLPSPGAASMSSYHDEFENASSPSWPRTPASPVYNNQVYDTSHSSHPQHVPHPPIPHHPKRPDGLIKLYELSDDPERRIFLDKLLRFNEERGSPMTNGPTLSKQPLDLFRLYMCVKERSGFQEVTKSRLWKEISITMGTGSSASTAYALRKQYIKHLLPFECKFDRGGIDPLPLISQLESSSRRKKANAAQAQVPPNTQDGFHGGHGVEGYPPAGAYPPGQYGPGGPVPSQHMNSEYPPGNQNCPPGMMPNHINSDSISVQDPFSDDMQYQRNAFPPSQYGNSGPPARGLGPQYHQGGYNSNNMPDQFNSSDPQQQYRRGSGGSMVQQEGNVNAVPPRNMPPQQFPGFQGGQFENRERFEQPQGSTMPPPSNQQPPQQYPPHRYSSPAPPPSSGPPPENNSFSSGNNNTRPPFPGHFNNHTSGNQMENTSSSGSFQGPMQENCYPPQNFPNQQGPVYNQTPPTPNKAATHNSGFQKREQFQSSSFPMSQGSTATTSSSKLLATITSNRSSSSNQYPPPYPPNQFRNDQQSNSGQNDSTTPQGWRGDNNQYNQFGSNHSLPNQPTSRDDWNSSRSASSWSRFGNSPMPNGPVPPYPGNNSSHAAQMPPGGSPVPPNGSPFMQHRFNQQKVPPFKQDNRFMQQQKMLPSSHPSSQYNNRREITFPPDSIEALPPLMVRRKTVSQKDIGSVEAWRILMALKSGLLSESTWALDVLSVLLYDDSSVVYFSLRHLPGLLEILWEHFRRVLTKIFGITDDLENMCYDMSTNKRRKIILSDEGRLGNEIQEYEFGPSYDDDHSKCDFGIVQGINHNEKTKILNVEDYTLKGRNGKPVKMIDVKDPFIRDSTDDWDRLDAGFDCGFEHWTIGGGDTTFHIQTHFSSEDIKDRFVCNLKDVKKSANEEDISSNVNECSTTTCSNNESNQTTQLCLNNRKRTFEECESNQEKKPNPVASSDKCQLESDEVTDDSASSKSNDETKVEAAESSEDVSNDKSDIKSSYPRFRDVLKKRTGLDNFDEESYHRDEPSLVILTDTQDDIARRCVCLSNLIRNLSFIPGNDIEFSKHPGLLLLLGRLLLLHHKHFIKRPPQRNYDKDEDADFTDSCSSLHAEKEWWWDMLNVIRENALVILSNIAGQLDLSCYPEDISLPLLDGLLHWSICPSAYARDALPTMPPHSVLSPQRLSLETLCKICVLDANVDLLLATPPFYRIERLYSVLTKSLSKGEDPVVREFAVTLLSYFALSDSSMCRIIALQGSCISLLIGFVEQAEQNAMQVANTHGINMLRENPEMMGTSLDMMRRAASTLLCLAKVPENRTLFVQHQSRLLTLVMSQILDQHVAGIISEILFECSLVEGEPPVVS